MDDNKNKNNDREKQEKVLFIFLTQVKKGEYAKIEESSIRYSRLKEQREDSYTEDEYYYSITT